MAVAIAAVSGCRTAAARPCVPAEGVEVWEIQRYASAGGDSSTATISVGVTPVSQAPVLGGSTRARQPVLRIVGPLGVAAPDTVRGSAMRADGQIPLPPRRLLLGPGACSLQSFSARDGQFEKETMSIASSRFAARLLRFENRAPASTALNGAGEGESRAASRE